MSLSISGAMVSASSTSAGTPDMVGISMLKKSMNADQSENAQLLNSIPHAPAPTGRMIDVYA